MSIKSGITYLVSYFSGASVGQLVSDLQANAEHDYQVAVQDAEAAYRRLQVEASAIWHAAQKDIENIVSTEVDAIEHALADAKARAQDLIGHGVTAGVLAARVKALLEKL